MAMAGQKSNRWREYCNPLRGLTMQRLMSLIEAGERGEFADLQWLYHYMERSDPVIYSVLQRRRAALLDCDWDLRLAAPVGDQLAVGSGQLAVAEAVGASAVAGEMRHQRAMERWPILKEVFPAKKPVPVKPP